MMSRFVSINTLLLSLTKILKMKKILFILSFVTGWCSSSQIIITPNPVDINYGIVTVTYGSNNDYSLFDPMGNPSLLLYTGLQTDADVATWDYHDDFNDTSTYIPFNYDGAANAYVAQIDVAGRMYQEEPSLNNVTLPANTVVYDWYFIIITPDLTRQSADLKGSDFGWQAAILSNDSFKESNFTVKSVKNQLYFDSADFYSIKTYNLQGQLVQDINRKYVGGWLDMSFLKKDQLYISKITSSNGSIVLKHIH
jgi:hypothetical protein